jgi:2-keto-3-deoxy-L-rhamnonate aldolase RhmA
MVARDTQEAERYRALGVDIMVVGVDIALRRSAFAEVIGRFTEKG